MTTLWPVLVSRAIRAPSPHNVRPWKLQPISADEAMLYADMDRALPAEDVTGSFMLCAMGLFVEALRIAAHAQSFDVARGLLAFRPGRLRRSRHPHQVPIHRVEGEFSQKTG